MGLPSFHMLTFTQSADGTWKKLLGSWFFQVPLLANKLIKVYPVFAKSPQSVFGLTKLNRTKMEVVNLENISGNPVSRINPKDFRRFICLARLRFNFSNARVVAVVFGFARILPMPFRRPSRGYCWGLWWGLKAIIGSQVRTINLSKFISPRKLTGSCHLDKQLLRFCSLRSNRFWFRFLRQVRLQYIKKRN